MDPNIKVLERRVFYPGDRVFREGDTGSCAYIVQDGAIEIIKKIEDKDVILGVVSKGGIFGEMALVDNAPRMASAFAVKQTSVILVPARTFQDKLAKTDPFIRALLSIFVKNIRAMTKKKS
ncbi:MAG: cyclic nucleotide-binding domain-containing protein [Alphaproteobacteria bacterium]|nr:cyclic nucleotide-binding domain-containing protein [Rhodospirillales bacterium]MCW9045735.1 cyclic nucleotide-binding domain-containing protein [Alphaproteobacteria bacterium]